eukprot:14491099-Alexandrium_andersonii.AAC.1
MRASLVGSEMCIRDSRDALRSSAGRAAVRNRFSGSRFVSGRPPRACLLYTSDAADDMQCVEL